MPAEHDGLDLAETRDLLDDDEGPEGMRPLDVDLEAHGNVVPGEVLALAERAVQPHRPG